MSDISKVREQLVRIQTALCDTRPKQAVGEMVEHALSLCDATPTLSAEPVAGQRRGDALPDSWLDDCMATAHQWAEAAYRKALGKPFQDIDALRDLLRNDLKLAIAAPTAPDGAVRKLTDEQIARAIWSIRRVDEDRCDMELEDMGKSHSVWEEARAVLALATPPSATEKEGK
jgi:hypothetical protein